MDNTKIRIKSGNTEKIKRSPDERDKEHMEI